MSEFLPGMEPAPAAPPRLVCEVDTTVERDTIVPCAVMASMLLAGRREFSMSGDMTNLQNHEADETRDAIVLNLVDTRKRQVWRALTYCPFCGANIQTVFRSMAQRHEIPSEAHASEAHCEKASCSVCDEALRKKIVAVLRARLGDGVGFGVGFGGRPGVATVSLSFDANRGATAAYRHLITAVRLSVDEELTKLRNASARLGEQAVGAYGERDEARDVAARHGLELEALRQQLAEVVDSLRKKASRMTDLSAGAALQDAASDLQEALDAAASPQVIGGAS